MERCKVCDKEFEEAEGYSRGSRGLSKRVFCSQICRKTYNASLEQGIEKTIRCATCGNLFHLPLSSCRKICDNCKKDLEEKKRYIGPHICELCGASYDLDYRKNRTAKKQISRFCSRTCSNRYSSREGKKLKKDQICVDCGKTFQKVVNTASKRCGDCQTIYYQKLHKRFYFYPENTPLGDFERSGVYVQKSSNLKKLGFDFNKDMATEYLKVQKFLYEDYISKAKTAMEIEEEYELSGNSLTTILLHLFCIPKRNLSEAIITSILVGNTSLAISTDPRKYNYKCGYHIDWEGSQHYLRSSFEFDFAKGLDEKKIHYETESLRIKYFDSQKNSYRVAIPDFYIPESNTIIEIKGCHFYDPINLNDRRKEFNNLGYKFYVYLDNNIMLEDFPPLKDIFTEKRKH